MFAVTGPVTLSVLELVNSNMFPLDSPRVAELEFTSFIYTSPAVVAATVPAGVVMLFAAVPMFPVPDESVRLEAVIEVPFASVILPEPPAEIIVVPEELRLAAILIDALERVVVCRFIVVAEMSPVTLKLPVAVTLNELPVEPVIVEATALVSRI